MHTVIDWQRPWLRSVTQAAQRVLQYDDWRIGLNNCAASDGLYNACDMPISFVDQAMLPQGIAYETFIYTTGQVPTRNNLHDFFNALVWLSFPIIKRQLNAVQAEQINTLSVSQSRGATRDAATIFDENAALLLVRDVDAGHILINALRNHQWHDFFVSQRKCFDAHIDIHLFGHALMEKLIHPYKAITAHAWIMFAPDIYFDLAEKERRTWLDKKIAAQIREEKLSIKNFTPLPVLGVPKWWPGQDDIFYQDVSVFRPKRDRA